MSAATTSGSSPGWAEQIRALEPVGDRLLAAWGRASLSEADRQDMYKLAFSALANGYLCHANMDPARPLWAPCWNLAMNLLGPAPDYVYMTAEVDPKGVYRISGYRGTSCFIEISQGRWEILGRHTPGSQTPPPTGDLDDLKIGPDGYFSVILSAERPKGHAGDWWRLDPDVVRLLMRKCAVDWRNEIDARVAIERLDEAQPMTTQDFTRRFANMAEWVEQSIAFDINLARYYRKSHGTNVLTRSKLMDVSGLQGQVYYDGAYEIADDEALIVETALPAKVRYWSVLVADDRFSTVDWVNRQSSLNASQARLDPDGRFRAVISKRDPGVGNWLDKADNPWGIIQLRWNRASDAPDPQVTKVPLADVLRRLPPGTPVLTPEQRKAQLGVRREAAQFRRLW
jgi:hypothetical protein